jgi:hypothetical protein
MRTALSPLSHCALIHEGVSSWHGPPVRRAAGRTGRRGRLTTTGDNHACHARRLDLLGARRGIRRPRLSRKALRLPNRCPALCDVGPDAPAVRERRAEIAPDGGVPYRPPGSSRAAVRSPFAPIAEQLNPKGANTRDAEAVATCNAGGCARRAASTRNPSLAQQIGVCVPDGDGFTMLHQACRRMAVCPTHVRIALAPLCGIARMGEIPCPQRGPWSWVLSCW